MKFIKVNQQNDKDFFLLNLANVNYIAANQKSGTCKVSLSGGATLSFFPKQARELLLQISEYNRQIVSQVGQYPNLEEDFNG